VLVPCSAVVNAFQVGGGWDCFFVREVFLLDGEALWGGGIRLRCLAWLRSRWVVAAVLFVLAGGPASRFVGLDAFQVGSCAALRVGRSACGVAGQFRQAIADTSLPALPAPFHCIGLLLSRRYMQDHYVATVASRW
jgi:hypothetical protein